MSAPAAAQSVTLQQAIESAATGHPAITQAKAASLAATAERKQAQSNYGPTLGTDANVFVWSSETTFGPTVVRDRVTWDVSVTLTQPLTPLWSVYHGVRAARMSEEAAELEIDSARRTQVRDTITAYYRVLQASGAVLNARRSVELLQAQLARVQALVEVGSAPASEGLRLEVALASSRQSVLRAQADLKLTQASLALAVGSEPGATVDAMALQSEALPPTSLALRDAIDTGLRDRAELEQLDLTRQQTEIGVLAKKADYLPQVVALAQYKRSAGSSLASADDAFVGASLSWTLFQWGGRKQAIDAAQAQTLQIEAAAEQARRQIAVQIQAAWLDLEASVGSHDVAAVAIVQAAEAYRIEEARYEEGEATTTELLDAQSALVEAENNKNAALYQAWINYAELVFSTGGSLAKFGENQ